MDPYMAKMLFTDPNDNDTLTAIIIKSLPIKLRFKRFIWGKLPRIQTKKVSNESTPFKPQHASSCISSYSIKKQSKIICRVYVCSKASVVEKHHKPIWSTIKLCGYTHCVRVTAHLAHGTPSFFPVTDGKGEEFAEEPHRWMFIFHKQNDVFTIGWDGWFQLLNFSYAWRRLLMRSSNC